MRFTIATLNLWNTEKWPARQPALAAFLERHQPDLLVVQEVRPALLAAVASALPEHGYVQNHTEAGWQTEGNVFWNRSLFSATQNGAEDVGIEESARRLFWVRLQTNDSTLLLATAHLTWRETQAEALDGRSPRLPQIRRVIETLQDLRQGQERLLFAGDLNDSLHVLRELSAAGFSEVFSALGRLPVPTWPVPCMADGIPEIDDWILFRGALRPMSVDVPDFFLEGCAPSDHRPVLATFAW